MFRLIVYTSILISLLFIGCANQNKEINDLAQTIYLQTNPREPLPPNKFKSDGCSLWFDGDWVECCIRHDIVYWQGGSRYERHIADADLERCVSKSGHPIVANLMHIGVRMGGVWWLPTPFRWGFGWNYPQYGPADIKY